MGGEFAIWHIPTPDHKICIKTKFLHNSDALQFFFLINITFSFEHYKVQSKSTETISVLIHFASVERNALRFLYQLCTYASSMLFHEFSYVTEE